MLRAVVRIMAGLPDHLWVDQLPTEQIPKALNELAGLHSRLAARLVRAPRSTPDSDALVDAPTLAARLGVPESHVRTLQRNGTIPFIQIGKYIRFRVAAVEAALSKAES
jgi:excisionase family DNA binding protein